jgi:hypothetical protein
MLELALYVLLVSYFVFASHAMTENFRRNIQPNDSKTLRAGDHAWVN